MKIIDDTYNGAKYPIVERQYNAYYFPDNFDPDNVLFNDDMKENHRTVHPYNPYE